MAKLSADACNEYFHIITRSATRSNNLIASFYQLNHHIMTKLACYSCYEKLNTITLPWTGSLFHVAHTVYTSSPGGVVTCSGHAAHLFLYISS